MSAALTSDQPCVCFTCGTRNYEAVTHCRGCGYKIKAGPGKYRDLSKITRKTVTR
jgi:hypothetical protein